MANQWYIIFNIDYFIYNTGSSAKGGYIPLDSLFVSTDPTTGTTTVAATVYSQSVIAEHLGIRPHFLPLFASLTGNDYLRPEVFEDQVARSLAAATGQKLSAANNTNHARIKATATFLKQYGAGSEFGTSNGGSGEGWEAVGSSLSSENDQVNGIMDEILKDREQLYASETEERRQEMRSALIESMEQYSPAIPDDFSTEESISSGESSLTSSEEPTPSTSIAGSPNLSTPSAGGSLWTAPEKSSLSVVAALNKTKEAFRAGQFSFKLMDVVSNRMFWCTPFLEDTDRESAWLASRDLRRWIYGILARDLLLLESDHVGDAQGSSETGPGAELEVVEYVRRGDHLSAEIVMGVSAMELDEMVKVVKVKAHKKSARRISIMDIDPVIPSSINAVEVSSAETESATRASMEIEQEPLQVQDQGIGETMDETSRTSLFLGILGADTAQVRALPKPFMILAATLRYLINALAHSKTRSASISVANFEVIAFVASMLFLREMYHPETICQQQRAGAAGAGVGEGSDANNIPITPTSSSSGTTLSGHPTSLVEAPPMTKRSLHLSTQYQHALATVSLLASALHLEDMIPPLAQLFDGLLFQQTLALARGGTLLEGRMQFPESVGMYHQILAAVEEDFVDTGEIDVVVVFRAGRKGASGAMVEGATKLSIFGPDMEPLNQLPSSTSSSTSGGSGLKGSKSAGIQKKPGSSKKRSGGGSNSSSGSNGRGSRGSGGGANMFNVLSLGCEF